MDTIDILAVDPAMANFGMAHFALQLDSLELRLMDLCLIQTEKRTTKQVRQNSDDLRRAQEIQKDFFRMVRGCHLVFAEIPSGGQNARAAYGFGMQVGILACSPVPVIQVQPLETKIAATGNKNATKDEMIAWATALYPAANWLRARGSATGPITKDNEHLADACGIAHAGLLTDQFRQLRSMWRPPVAA